MNYLEIRTKAISENELVIRTALIAFLLPLNPTNDELLELKTICAEAVVNVIVHAYPNEVGDIRVRLSYTNRTIEMIIEDYGVGITNLEDKREVFVTSKEQEEHCGMGFTIMETFSDDIKIDTTMNKGTKITLIRSLHGIE